MEIRAAVRMTEKRETGSHLSIRPKAVPDAMVAQKKQRLVEAGFFQAEAVDGFEIGAAPEASDAGDGRPCDKAHDQDRAQAAVLQKGQEGDFRGGFVFDRVFLRGQEDGGGEGGGEQGEAGEGVLPAKAFDGEGERVGGSETSDTAKGDHEAVEKAELVCREIARQQHIHANTTHGQAEAQQDAG